MSTIRVKHVTHRHDSGPVVLRDVSFKVDERERIAVVGANGSGKTTLLRLLAGEVDPTEGTVERDAGLRVAHFTQFSSIPDDRSVLDLLEEVVAPTLAVQAELTGIEEQFSDPDADFDALLARQAELLAEMERVDGWDVRRRIETVLSKLGFDDELARRSAGELSGGWRNRAALAVLVLDPPDVVLFDEPTNYLDIEGVAWLESWVRNLPGAAVIASHDRHFIDQVATRFVEVEAAALTSHEGRFEDFIRNRQTNHKAIDRRTRVEAELWAFELAAVADRREAQKNPSAFLRRRLADAKRSQTPPLVDEVVTGLYERLHIGDRLGRTEGLGMERDGHALFSGLDLEVDKGDRIGIIGPNGCGKSTLLDVLLGAEEPTSGRVVIPPNIDWVSFEHVRRSLDLTDTLTHAVNTAGLVRTAPRKQVHAFLEVLGFSELDLGKRIGELSGGQQARAALATCLLSGAAVLVADEPTNHLDVTTTQIMERAFQRFPGAVIVVSHDRFFLDKVANRLLVFEDGGVQQVSGTWSTWQAQR